MMTRRRAAAALTVVAALTLTACAAEADPAENDVPPEVVVDVVEVPESMLTSGDAITLSGSLLTAVGDLPHAIGGGLAEPGEPTSPTVWTSDDGHNWKEVPVGDVEGSFDGGLAGDDQVTVLTGSVWSAGTISPAIWVSDDRQDWRAIDLPDEFTDDYWFEAVGVVDGVIIATGVDIDGDSIGLLIDGDDTTVVDLPDDADMLRSDAITGNDDTYVLIARPGDWGDSVSPVAYVSVDGDDWSDASVIDAEGAYVAGAVWTGDQFVATGYAPEEGSYRAAAWSSPDGETWTRETLPALPDWWQSDPGSDTWLGLPATDGDIVTVMMGNAYQSSAGFLTRASDGTWAFAGTTGELSSAGVGGWAVPGTEGIVGVTLGLGEVRIGVLDDDIWDETEQLTQREYPHQVTAVTAGRDGAHLTLTRSVFTTGEQGAWRESSESVSATLSGDTVEITPADPERTESLVTVVRAFDGDAEAVIGSDYPAGEEIILAEGYFRPSADAEWTPMTGFDTDGATNFYDMERIGDRWIAVGAHREASLVGVSAHATVWTSPDGIAWQQAAGDFGSGTLESGMDAVCALPDGTPVGVGWVEQENHQYAPAAWMADGDEWERLDIGSIDNRYGWFTSCAWNDEGIVISGYSDGRDTVWHTADGDDWDRVYRAENGVLLTGPVAVDGGFAAAGSRTVGSSSSPVVWLSADGEDWVPVTVPSQRLTDTLSVAAVGDDLLVTLPPEAGDPLLIVRDIADVIAAHTG